MKQFERVVIEEFVLKTTNELLREWKEKFQKFSVYSDIPYINRNNDETDYFSEIEINFWNEDGSFVTVFSIIIFMQNKQVLSIDEAKNYIQGEIEICYNECLDLANAGSVSKSVINK